MLSVNNQRRPLVDTNVTPSVGITRPSTEQDSPASNSNSLSASPTLTGYGTHNGPYSTLEARSCSSSASSVLSLGGLSITDIQSEQKSSHSSSFQQDTTDASLTPTSVDSPTNAAASSLTRRVHIAGHAHDRSRSASIDGEIEHSAWSLEKVLQWLEDNA
ncbi:3464_t:CDS:1, partial [Acaulospora colombiana]